MSTSFHLRPVHDNQNISPSPSPSATPPADHTTHTKPPSVLLPLSPPSASANPRSRRPLSPSSLRDVDLSHGPDMPPRKYPAPPTGHDLMAMFPAPAPDACPELRPGPTSGYFQRQERAFFAQAGKEIIRVRVEIDAQGLEEGGSGSGNGNGKARDTRGRGEPAPTRTWPGAPGPSQASSSSQQHQSPSLPAAPPQLYPHPASRPSQRVPGPVTPAPLLFQMSPHAQSSQPPPNPHPPTPHHPGVALRSPIHDSGAPSVKPESQSEEYRDDPDEAWRRPMPYAERRRAGKHTRRVIVRN